VISAFLYIAGLYIAGLYIAGRKAETEQSVAMHISPSAPQQSFR
jgi:hypothetical protein